MTPKESAIERIGEETARDIEQGVTSVAPPDGDAEHKKRTLGNKIFDVAVWPTIAFGAVYVLSTWAVKAARDTGSSMSRFYEGLAKSLEKHAHVKATQSHNLALVLISFAVGTALMAPIKWLEDSRGKISKKIDAKLGTTPDDPSHYAREPKQSWRSILGGRLVTFLSVLGISFSIGEKRTHQIEDAASSFVKEQWHKMRPNATAETLEKVGHWTKANAFEMFYTSLCAGMVYVLSRVFARKINKHDEQQRQIATSQGSASTLTDNSDTPKRVSWQVKAGTREPPQKPEGFVKIVDNSRAALVEQPALG